MAPKLAAHETAIMLNGKHLQARRGSLSSAATSSISPTSSGACWSCATSGWCAPAPSWRQAEGARRRDQPAAGDAGDAIFAERAEGRAVLAPGAAENATSTACPRRCAKPPRRAAADHGSRRQIRHHAVALVDRAVPAVLRAPRSARGGVQRLDPARRDGQGDRQPRHHRRDHRAARRVRGAARLQDLRRVQPRRDDGQDAGQRARPAVGGVGAGGEARDRASATRCRAAAREEGGNFAIAPWDWRYYAEKERKARYDVDEASTRPYLDARQRHRRRLRHGDAPVRPEVQGAARRAALSRGRARVGGDRQARRPRRPVPRRLFRAPVEALRRVDVGVPLAVEGGGRGEPRSSST